MEKHEIESLFERVIMFIEATEFEKEILKEKRLQKILKENDDEILWEEQKISFYKSISPYEKRTKDSTTVHFSFVTISHYLFCFYEPTSMIVDYQAIKEYLNKYRGLQTDACNFPNRYDEFILEQHKITFFDE